MIGSLGRDLRFALRTLARSPGYTAAAVLTLALAIGATTTTFSVLEGLLLRPFPYASPAELVRLSEQEPQLPNMSIAYDDLLDWRAGQKSFTTIAGYRSEGRNLTGFSTPEQIQASLVSWDLFQVLGVRPLLGRTFTAEEDRKGAPAQVAVLGNGFWRSHFASDPGVVGRTLTLDGKPFTIIGVAPEGLDAFEGASGVFIPLAWTQGPLANRGAHPGLYAMGRLRPGVSLDRAREDLGAIAKRLEAAYPRSNDGVSPKLQTLRDATVGKLRPMLVLLMCAAAFVLLIAVANVANLMLARGSVRRREMAIRTALGAGRQRLVRQLLVESGLVGLFAGLAGILLSLWGVAFISANRPSAIPTWLPISVDGWVLAFAVICSVGAGILFGLLPALQISRTELTSALKEGDARGGSGHGHRVRGALVVAEVALALVLLVGAGLAIRGFVKLLQVDTGMRPDHLLTFSYVLPAQKYATLGEIEGFHRRFKARLEALPGVTSVSLSYGMPLQGAPETSFSFEGEPQVGAGHTRMANVFEVEPGFFETLGIDIVRGRAFTREDLTSGGRKVIVDEELARRYLDPKNPFSRRFAGRPQLGIPPAEIVGIARHITHNGLEDDGQTPSQFYRLWGQTPDNLRADRIRAMDVSLRTEGDPAALAATVRQAAAEVDPDQPLIDVKTMAQRVEDAGASRRFSMSLLALFGALALLISAMGLYAVIGYTVSQRTREIGIRMALGAQPGGVRRMVVGQGMRLTALGLLLGALGALALSGVMRRFVFAVQATDPLTFAAVVVLLLGVGAVASFVPARRASRVHPMSALREE